VLVSRVVAGRSRWRGLLTLLRVGPPNAAA